MTARSNESSVGIFLAHIGFAVGESAQIASLPEISSSPETLDRLTRGGLADFRQSDLSAWQLAADSARLTLDSSNTDALDLVVYATDSFWDSDEHELNAGRFLHACGLDRTPLIGVGLAGCANFALAMRTAVSSLRGGDATAALVSTADVCQPEQRLLGSGIGVLSDGAATCVVTTRRPEQGLQFLGMTMSVEAGLHAVTSSGPMAMAMATSRGVNRAATALYEKIGLSPGDVSYLVTNNYVEAPLRVFANASGVPFDRIYRGTVADCGHCFASDALINLATMTSERMLQPGDRVLVIASGYNSWGCMAFSVV